VSAPARSPASRAVFLDRDGVLNEAHVVDGVPRPATTVDELRILPDAHSGCEVLREAGFLLVCVTNQPDIARGTLSRAAVDEINAALAAELGLDEVIVCPHDDADGCACRKPKPGMTLDAARRHDIDLVSSFTVGDRWRDVEAGRNAGTATVFVDRHYDELLPNPPDAVVGGLEEASEWIVEQARA
jgi:D-glycero-D-manno-heptose 1,7-bisphosphate phosphatase